jgi:hypothetical protein
MDIPPRRAVATSFAETYGTQELEAVNRTASAAVSTIE